jgi:hypothetical protein
MTATVRVATSGSRPELINDMYRRLRRIGFDDAEAANLTALRNGFGMCAQPWTVRAVAHPERRVRLLTSFGARWPSSPRGQATAIPAEGRERTGTS